MENHTCDALLLNSFFFHFSISLYLSQFCTQIVIQSLITTELSWYNSWYFWKPKSSSLLFLFRFALDRKYRIHVLLQYCYIYPIISLNTGEICCSEFRLHVLSEYSPNFWHVLLKIYFTFHDQTKFPCSCTSMLVWDIKNNQPQISEEKCIQISVWIEPMENIRFIYSAYWPILQGAHEASI